MSLITFILAETYKAIEPETMEKKELEARVVSKVAEVISAIKNAKHVDHVISSLHSIATLLFPLDPNLLSGSVGHDYREQILTVKVPSSKERDDWWRVFYQGPAFSTLARFLLLDVASNWLACFPFSAQKYVYDVFFVRGFITEVLQILVPFLKQNRSDDLDINVVISNSERLLVLCLLENNGVLQIAREFGGLSKSKGFTDEQMKPDISRMAQIVASIPDIARMNSPTSLSSHLFFRQIIAQVLSLEEEREVILIEKIETSDEMDKNGALLFIGEMFSRICRRGSAGN